MDGVIADFDKAIKEYDPSLNTYDSEDYEVRSKRVDAICEENFNIFQDLDPIPGARLAILELRELFEIYFLSTPMWNVPHSFTDKRIWIDKHYGRWAHKRLILTHRKDLNIGDFLVDDRTRNGTDKFTGEHIHFGTERFPNWATIGEYLKSKV